MRSIVIVVLALVLVSSSVYASEPGGWSFWMYVGEATAGLLGGYGMAVLAANTVYNDDNLESDENMYMVMGSSGLGAAGGVLLVGELIGAKSKNKIVTYPVTIGASLALPLIFAATFETPLNYQSDSSSTGLGYAVAYGLNFKTSGILNPNIVAITYNSVKKPTMPPKTKDVGLRIKPYSTFIADSSGSYFPAYGVSVSF